MMLSGLLRPCGASMRAFNSAAGLQPASVSCLRDIQGVVRISGEGAVSFLQGLISNDAHVLEAPGAKPLYACILTPYGRVAHDIILHQERAGAEPSLLVEADKRGIPDLMKLLLRYRMHQRKVSIEDVSDEFSVWVQFGGPAFPEPTGPWQQDPRLPALGLRAILPSRAAPPPVGDSQHKEVMWRAYRRWRILQGVAEGGSEMPSGNAVPAEFNLESLNAVSFTKGCYVGQEFVARIHFKGVVRKRLMPFRVEAGQSACCLDPGSAVCDVYDAAGALESVGAVRAREGDVGLALLKLTSGLTAAQDGDPLYVKCGGAGQYVAVRPWRPSWWPAEWGREEEGAEPAKVAA